MKLMLDWKAFSPVCTEQLRLGDVGRFPHTNHLLQVLLKDLDWINVPIVLPLHVRFSLQDNRHGQMSWCLPVPFTDFIQDFIAWVMISCSGLVAANQSHTITLPLSYFWKKQAGLCSIINRRFIQWLPSFSSAIRTAVVGLINLNISVK